jgi:hypothetical protein
LGWEAMTCQLTTENRVHPDPKLPRGTDKCLCRACGQYFKSSGTFTKHRVGNWEAQGANRRCLTVEEMSALGWLLNETGHWIRGKRPASAPARHGRSGDRPKPLSEVGVPDAPVGAARVVDHG